MLVIFEVSKWEKSIDSIYWALSSYNILKNLSKLVIPLFKYISISESASIFNFSEALYFLFLYIIKSIFPSLTFSGFQTLFSKPLS